jgi:uncharacterized protein YerC
MINNSALLKWDRLKQKQLSQQFIYEITEGLNCSAFEAQAVLDTVYRVFGAYFESNTALKPGQMRFEVVSEAAPPQLPLAKCPLVTVVLTLDAGQQDLQVKETNGIAGLRQQRIQRLTHEAYQQGGLLTVEDLANRLLNCGERTLSRDLAALGKEGIVLPLRSTVKDMGRSITHRSQIVKLWLDGKEYSQIAKATYHSVDAVANYIEKFKRVIALMKEGYDIKTISFLVKISTTLTEEYIAIFKKNNIIPFRQSELDDLLKKQAPPLKLLHKAERRLL